jgi:pyrroline-5-carboxylate reductase
VTSPTNRWFVAAVHLTQATPLPFVARGQGVTAVFPGDQATATIFDVLGNAVECDKASALMAAYFGIMHAQQNGSPKMACRKQRAAPIPCPCLPVVPKRHFMQGKDVDFVEMSREFATKSGLNEQVFRDFDERCGTQALTRVLDRVFERINNR